MGCTTFTTAPPEYGRGFAAQPHNGKLFSFNDYWLSTTTKFTQDYTAGVLRLSHSVAEDHRSTQINGLGRNRAIWSVGIILADVGVELRRTVDV
jgi:hypothetical protein